jgi:hypothetical protein
MISYLCRNIKDMASERDLIKLEKEIKSRMIQIKNKKITPAESGIGKLVNMLKPLDEVLFEKIMSEYKQIIQNLK